MNIAIRRATPDDAQTLALHNAAMAAETETITLDPERALRGVEAVLRDPAKGFYLLAEADGAVAGQLMITFEWSDWRNGVFWWLQSVYVRPEHRRRGVFTRLYRAMREEADKSGGVCGVRLYVESANQRAQQTYQRLGLRQAHYQMYEEDFVLGR
jgi:ribosomal protein S18 acetylase RimI-like enzyme